MGKYKVKLKTLKKILKKNEINALYEDKAICFDGKDFRICGTDYEGEAWDSIITVKDLKQYIKKHKFRGFEE